MHRICFPSCATACSCQPGARLRSPVMRANCIPPIPPTLRVGSGAHPPPCWHRRNSVPPLGTRAWSERHSLRMRMACSRRRRRTDGVAHCRMSLDSLSAPWHTRATHAAPAARRVPTLTTVSGWSGPDALSLDASRETSPVSWGEHPPRRLAGCPLSSPPPGRGSIAVRPWCPRLIRSHAPAVSHMGPTVRPSTPSPAFPAG